MHQAVERWFGAEVQEQADLEGAAAEVVLQLTLAGGIQRRTGFQFDDYFVLDDEVCSEQADDFLLVVHVGGGFATYLKPTVIEFARQGIPPYRFEETIPQSVVYIEEAPMIVSVSSRCSSLLIESSVVIPVGTVSSAYRFLCSLTVDDAKPATI